MTILNLTSSGSYIYPQLYQVISNDLNVMIAICHHQRWLHPVIVTHLHTNLFTPITAAISWQQLAIKISWNTLQLSTTSHKCHGSASMALKYQLWLASPLIIREDPIQLLGAHLVIHFVGSQGKTFFRHTTWDVPQTDMLRLQWFYLDVKRTATLTDGLQHECW